MKKISSLILFLLIFLFLFSGCMQKPVDTFTFSPTGSIVQHPVVSETPENTDQPIASNDIDAEPSQKTTSIKLSSIGDIMSHYTQILDAYDSENDTYDYSNSLKYIKNYTEPTHLLIANLETVMAQGEYTGYPLFNTPPALASNLKDIGVDIVSMANNHSLDKGFEGLAQTIQNVKQADLMHLGTYDSQQNRDEHNGVLAITVNEINLVFLNYTYGTNYIRIPQGKEFCINLLYEDYMGAMSVINKELILHDLQYAESLNPDLIIGLIHWGDEYVTVENKLQRETAEFLFENGMDIILGNHSHVLQPAGFQTITTSENVEKQVFVSYSLGNFMSNITRTHFTLTSAILSLYIEKDFESDTTYITHYDYVPVYMLTPEWGGPRFYVLPTHEFISKYESGDKSLISDEIYADLLESLKICHDILGKENDYMYSER